MIFVNQRSRKRNRLIKRNYSRSGIYYVTICTDGMEYFFGDISNNIMRRSTIGEIAVRCWNDLPTHFSNIDLGEYVVMPNHVHGIIFIQNTPQNAGNRFVAIDMTSGADKTVGEKLTRIMDDVGVAYMRPLQRDVQRDVQRDKMLLPKIVHEYKSAVTRIAHLDGYEYFKWQRSYYDHIVRDAWDLQRITNYIKFNPMNWKYFKNYRKNT